MKKAIELATVANRIKRLIIFGGALTTKCGIDSDVDIALDVLNINFDDFAKLERPFI